MTMDTLQIRLNKGLVGGLDIFVKEGLYANRAEVIRDAIRRFLWNSQIGSIKNDGIPSVRQVRAVRKKLSLKEIDLDEINSL
jgi:Arc/MetJ-type ribon-helix-helix transcriptional regulator